MLYIFSVIHVIKNYKMEVKNVWQKAKVRKVELHLSVRQVGKAVPVKAVKVGVGSGLECPFYIFEWRNFYGI
jgi:hypothetical protein